MVQAKKYLGQHFLKDEDICLAIAEGMPETEVSQKILEIGPGRGAITKYLIEKYPNLSVVEVDGDSISFLSETYPTLDVIDFDLSFLHNKPNLYHCSDYNNKRRLIYTVLKGWL